MADEAAAWPPWLRADPYELARYVTSDAARWLTMPANLYDTPDSREARRGIVTALYAALCAQNVAYAWEKYDPSDVQQLVRTPAEVLDRPHEGTCLDLALLFAGLCLAAELIPVVVVLDGHALVAVNLERGLRRWDDALRLDRKYFEDPLSPPGTARQEALQAFVRDGSYLAIECTGFAGSTTLGTLAARGFPESIGRDARGYLSFDRAVEAGAAQLAFAGRPLRFAVELAIARYVWKRDAFAIPGSPPRGLAPIACAVPALPPNFLARAAESDPVLAALVAPGGASIVGLWGMGGTGKSVVAAAVAREAKAAFDDVFWLTIGRMPSVLELQNALYHDLTGERDTLTSAVRAREAIGVGFGARRALLVLDDVWNVDDAAAFAVPSARVRTLITTRNSEILAGLSAPGFRLDVLAPQAALALLASWAGSDARELPPLASDVAGACGYLPLALALVGAMARLQTSWADILTRLQRADLAKIANRFPKELYPYRTLLAAVGVSIDALDADDRERYLDLAVFPDRVAIPVGPLALVWQLDDLDVRDCMTRLVARSLAGGGDDPGVPTLRLHDLQRDLIRKEREATLSELHARLVDAWDAHPERRDTYAWRWTGYHLLNAGRVEDFRRRLFDGAYACAKLDATDFNALVADYDGLPADADVRLIRETLRLAAHIVGRDAGQLASQLVGRLVALAARPNIASFLQSLTNAAPRPWLRPLAPALDPPGSSLLQTLAGHTWPVYAVAVTPDDAWAVSGSGDWTVKVWDVADGRVLRTLTGHRSAVVAIAVTPDGRRAISASRDATLKVWDLTSGRELLTLEGHADAVDDVAVTSDGRRAVSASEDDTLIVWDLEVGTMLRRLTGHAREVVTVAVTPDDSHLVSGSTDATIKVWNLATGTDVRTLTGHTNSVLDVAVTSDGRSIVSVGNGVVKVWDVASGAERFTLGTDADGISAVALMPGDGRAFTVGRDRSLRLWDLQSRSQASVFYGHAGRINDVAVASKAGFAVSASDDKTLKVWNVVGAPASVDACTAGIVALATTSDGTTAALACDDGSITIWDVDRARVLRRFQADRQSIGDVTITPDGTQVMATSSDRLVTVWDLTTGVERQPIGSDTQQLMCLALTPDGGRLVSGAWEDAVNVRDAATGAMVSRIAVDVGFANDLAVAPDGRYVVVAGNDTTLRILKLDSGREVRKLTGHTDAVKAVVLTCDGNAVSCSIDGTLRVWELASGAALQTLRGHTGWVYGVAVTPDGRYAVSASQDATLKMWDLRTGANVATYACDAEARCCAITSRGVILCGDRGGRLHSLILESSHHTPVT